MREAEDGRSKLRTRKKTRSLRPGLDFAKTHFSAQTLANLADRLLLSDGKIPQIISKVKNTQYIIRNN